ncbi:MAG: aldolase [Acidobacteria bacterium]|jgi:fructose-bisphosphate aldolase/6-deoxy-5-ketofructose 1-phosphate synthase|nr:aldolase [Acidobacteriota bacterium]
MEEKTYIPADVPNGTLNEYLDNYDEITLGSGRLMLFAGDQKIEHLNDDFYGEGIAADDADPEHLFKIASEAEIGVFATQLGLVSLYGNDYPDIPYLIKLNSKTNLVKTAQQDPVSTQMIDVRQVVEFKKNTGLNILGVGYTVYLGSEYENAMIREAAQAVHWAHHHGLLTVLWIYPRGKAVKDEKAPELIAGATGVAATLGSDFVKVNYPKKEGQKSAEIFKQAIKAAGRTKVVCAGGSSMEPRAFLQQLHDQIFISGAMGNATGRNIHQKPLDEAVRLTNAITAITVYGKPVDEAFQVYMGKEPRN